MTVFPRETTFITCKLNKHTHTHTRAYTLVFFRRTQLRIVFAADAFKHYYCIRFRAHVPSLIPGVVFYRRRRDSMYWYVDLMCALFLTNRPPADRFFFLFILLRVKC